jgi:uncharacterized membrane protein YfcA
MKISQETFFVLLGCSLSVAAILLWIKTKAGDGEKVSPPGKYSVMKDAVIGGGIGFLSGMVGIGGGIFLSPLLNLMKGYGKNCSYASVFILVN